MEKNNETKAENFRQKEYWLSRMFAGSTGVAHAVFVTLAIGLLFETIGKMIHFPMLVVIGTAAKLIFSPAIGVGVAIGLRSNTLTVFSSMIAATLGAGAIVPTDAGFTITIGEPIGAVMAAIVATFIGRRITGKTPLDMMAIPISAVLIGGLSGIFFFMVTGPVLIKISRMITESIEFSPILGSAVIALLWSILLMSPASSAAMGIALHLDPVSSGAALIGCVTQFVGFTIMGYKENNLGGHLAQFLCTPKVQFPNVTKNIYLLIPPFISAMIVAPIATLMGFQATETIAGLGLSSFIAPLYILEHSGFVQFLILFGIGGILSGIITYLIYLFLCKKNWIKKGDLAMKI